MKKTLIWTLCAILFIAFVMVTAFPPHKLYTVKARVYLVDFKEVFSIFEDENGNMWGMCSTNVPAKGTSVILTMDSNNTETIYDDGIVRYEEIRAR